MPIFRQRTFPSANTVLLGGGVVVDPGHDAAEAQTLLVAENPEGWPTWLVTTHWHSDHAGAVAALQAQGVRVAVSAAEAERIDAWGPDTGRIWWLRQDLQRYRVDRRLAPGDTLEAAGTAWTVLALPGHTAEQIGLHDPASGTVISGDALHAADIGWLDLDADPSALDQTEATLDALARLRPRLVLPGHGPAITDVPDALARGRRRLAGFRSHPERAVFHACKRIWTHALMTDDGIAAASVAPFLLGCPWFLDSARRLGLTPDAFAPVLQQEMLRSGAAAWQDGWLVAAGDYIGRGSRRSAA